MCPSDPPDSPNGAWPLNPSGAWLSYVVNRGYNGRNGDPAVGVCFDQTAANSAQVSIDYITSHDGVATTLLLAESPLTPMGSMGAGATTTTFPYTGFSPALHLLSAVATTDSSGYYFVRPYSAWWDSSGNDPAWPESVTPASYGELTLGFEWSALGKCTLARVSNQIAARHAGIVNVSFCDGHTQSIRDDIDINVFKHICTPNDAQCVNEGLLVYPANAGSLDESQLK
jgi:prepilin-type processing-associated H-X9-DG protein